MVVKVRRIELILGKESSVSAYLPESAHLNKEKREKADLLDVKIKDIADSINRDFDKLPKDIQNNEFKKWKWLGNRLADAIKELNKEGKLEQTDIDTNAIWPGFGQYFRAELYRGVTTRRSGDKKDHYRKCWLLAITPHTDWIRIWAGWDAFVDRGEQLVGSNKVMPLLEKKLSGVKLGKEDYQNIAREIANELPSGAKGATIQAMSDSDLDEIIDRACRKVINLL